MEGVYKIASGSIIVQTLNGSAASVHGNATAAAPVSDGKLGESEQAIFDNSQMCDKCKLTVLNIIKQFRK